MADAIYQVELAARLGERLEREVEEQVIKATSQGT